MCFSKSGYVYEKFSNKNHLQKTDRKWTKYFLFHDLSFDSLDKVDILDTTVCLSVCLSLSVEPLYLHIAAHSNYFFNLFHTATVVATARDVKCISVCSLRAIRGSEQH